MEKDNEPRSGIFDKLKYLWSGNRATTSEELEQEIQGLVDQGEAQGLLSAHEGEMIEAVLELDETTVGQIMVPRTELACLPSEADFPDMIKVIVDSGHSRLPVYSEDLDHIVGVIHAKDLLLFWGSPPHEVELAKVVRKPFFVPQAMKVDELLTAFKRRRVHLAIVVDEYGGTAGVVTLEDVLEEIVGEIEDEYDQSESMLSSREDGSFVVDARMEVEDLSEHLGVELPEELPEGRFETVGGFVTTLLGRVPVEGEMVNWGGVSLKVTSAEDRRISQLLVTNTNQSDNSGERKE